MSKAALLPLSRKYGSSFFSGSIFLGVIYKRLQELFLVNQTNTMVNKTRSVLASLIYIQTSIKIESVLQNVFLVGIFLTVNLHCHINPGRDTRSSVNAFRLWTYNNFSLCYLEKVDFFSDF